MNLNSKIYTTGAFILLVILLITGNLLYHRGYKNGSSEVVLKSDLNQSEKISLKIKSLRDSIKTVTDENVLVKTRNVEMIKKIQVYQLHQNIIRNTNVSDIKQMSDSIKDKRIDSIQVVDKNGILIDYANYINLSNSYDSCQSENGILQSTIDSDSSVVESYKKLDVENNQLTKAKLKQSADLLGISNSKLRTKNFWIFAGWGTAIGETALFVYTAIKSSALK